MYREEEKLKNVVCVLLPAAECDTFNVLCVCVRVRVCECMCICTRDEHERTIPYGLATQMPTLNDLTDTTDTCTRVGS